MQQWQRMETEMRYVRKANEKNGGSSDCSAFIILILESVAAQIRYLSEMGGTYRTMAVHGIRMFPFTCIKFYNFFFLLSNNFSKDGTAAKLFRRNLLSRRMQFDNIFIYHHICIMIGC